MWNRLRFAKERNVGSGLDPTEGLRGSDGTVKTVPYDIIVHLAQLRL